MPIVIIVNTIAREIGALDQPGDEAKGQRDKADRRNPIVFEIT
jgi:hypothetical protein